MDVFKVSWTSDSRNGRAFAHSFLLFEGAESMRSGLGLVILMRDFDLKIRFFGCYALGGHC